MTSSFGDAAHDQVWEGYTSPKQAGPYACCSGDMCRVVRHVRYVGLLYEVVLVDWGILAMTQRSIPPGFTGCVPTRTHSTEEVPPIIIVDTAHLGTPNCTLYPAATSNIQEEVS